MKKLFLFSALFLAVLAGNAQTKVKTDANGNFIAVMAERKKTPDVMTGKYFILPDGEKLPVYQSAKLDSLGNTRFYVIRKAKKSGNEYRQYLTVQK